MPLSARIMAEKYHSQLISEKTALIFGREDNGLRPGSNGPMPYFIHDNDSNRLEL